MHGAAAADMDHTVQPATVDDRGIRADADDREFIGDVQIARGRGVLAGAWDVQRVGARRQLDGIGPGTCVRFLDRRAQRAVAGRVRTQAVTNVGVDRVVRGVNLEDGEEVGRSERGDQCDERARRREQPGAACWPGSRSLPLCSRAVDVRTIGFPILIKSRVVFVCARGPIGSSRETRLRRVPLNYSRI